MRCSLRAIVNENVQLGTRLLLVLPASPIAALICSSSLLSRKPHGNDRLQAVANLVSPEWNSSLARAGARFSKP